MEQGSDDRDLVLDLLRERAVLKQDVYALLRQHFADLKAVVAAEVEALRAVMEREDPRVGVSCHDRGEMACEMKLAGDLLILHMHTNVFKLDRSHSLWKGSYLTEDWRRGYFGMINIYNFLSDSFKYDRDRDLGYLVARILVNREGHFFVQGKRQLGFLYNDLAHGVLDRAAMASVLRSVALYVLDFDLLTPPYDHVDQVTVQEMKQLNAHQQLSTGKRLGFRFQVDAEDIQ